MINFACLASSILSIDAVGQPLLQSPLDMLDSAPSGDLLTNNICHLGRDNLYLSMTCELRQVSS